MTTTATGAKGRNRVAVKKWLGHGLTKCTVCDWREEDYLTVQRKARNHSQNYSHKVMVDLGFAVEYTNPSRRIPKKNS